MRQDNSNSCSVCVNESRRHHFNIIYFILRHTLLFFNGQFQALQVDR